MEEHNVDYFRNLWQINMADLQNQCEVWDKICMNNPVPDEVHGDIRTNIGLARLLMNQKLKQFKGLIDDSEFNTGEKEITCLDLQGFWDMVYNEVEKIKKCFYRLDKCKNNEWRYEEENSEKLLKKKVPVKKEVTVSNKKDDSTKSHILAAKQRLAEAKKKMLALREQQKKQDFVEIIQSNVEGFNHTQNLNSNDKEKDINASEFTNTALAKEPNEKIKQDVRVSKKKVICTEKSDLVEETVVLNEEMKYKAGVRKGHTASVQDKENLIPDNESSNAKYISKTQTKSKEKIEATVTVKKRGKSKDYGKLQCVTRSAKRALLIQQNMMQK